MERMVSAIRLKTDSSQSFHTELNTSTYINSLGPGQILPKGQNLNLRCVGELHLAASLEKTVLELKVITTQFRMNHQLDRI